MTHAMTVITSEMNFDLSDLPPPFAPAEPSYPDIVVDATAVDGVWHLTGSCPWGCKDRRGKPKLHRHSGGNVEDGPPLAPGQWTGRASHCRQAGAPSSYELVLRDKGERP